MFLPIFAGISPGQAAPSEQLGTYIKALSGLVLYYPLDEESGTIATNQAPDTLGSFAGNNTSATVNQSGQSGPAYRFNGSTSYIDIASDAAFIPGTASFSYFGIFRYLGTGGTSTVLRKGSNANTYLLRVNNAGNLVGLIGNGTQTASVVGTTAVGTTNWHLGLVNVDRVGGSVYMYQDGDLANVASAQGSATAITTTSNFQIGRNLGNPEPNPIDYMNGYVQHVGYRNGTTSTTELSQIISLAGL